MAGSPFSPKWSQNGHNSPSANGHNGCILDRQGRGPACRVWTGEFHSWHINCLELRAVFLALIHFLPSLRGCHVIFRTDNMAVVSHIFRQGGVVVAHPKQAWTPSPPFGSGQVPLLESGSHPGSLEPRSQLSVETEAQAGGVDVEPPIGSPDMGFVRQSGSGPLCITGVAPIPTLVLPELSGTSGHRCVPSPLAGHEAVRVSAHQAYSVSPVQGSGGQSTQIKYLSKSTDTYNKILLQ